MKNSFTVFNLSTNKFQENWNKKTDTNWEEKIMHYYRF